MVLIRQSFLQFLLQKTPKLVIFLKPRPNNSSDGDIFLLNFSRDLALFCFNLKKFALFPDLLLKPITSNISSIFNTFDGLFNFSCPVHFLIYEPVLRLQTPIPQKHRSQSNLQRLPSTNRTRPDIFPIISPHGLSINCLRT